MMFGQETSTFGNMPGSTVYEYEKQRQQKIQQEGEEKKILYKFNIGDKIKVTKIAKIYKNQLNINIGKVGEISRILDYVNNKISYGKSIEHLDNSTRQQVFCTDIDLSEEFPNGLGSEPPPDAPQIIYDILFNIPDEEYPDNPAKTKWINLYFSEDGIEKVNKGGRKRRKRRTKRRRTKKRRKRQRTKKRRTKRRRK